MKNVLVLGLCLFAPCPGVQAQPPQALIHNKQLQVRIYLPDAQNGFYRGVRFDWSGVIADLEFSGHHLYRPWFALVDPTQRDVGYQGSDVVVGANTAMTGPAEEFQEPLGYAAAKPGGTFLKIGVGLLRRSDDTPYSFGAKYDLVDGGKWTVHQTSRSITFEQTLGGRTSDYGYVYTKTIRLVGDSSQLVIEHRLRNTGRLSLASRVYDHNFLTIDGLGVGSAYAVSVPYNIQPTRPPDERFFRLEGQRAFYVADLKDQDRATCGLQGFSTDARDYDFTVSNRAAHVQVRVVGDRPLVNATIWSIRSVVAVEPFIQVRADPGKEYSWSYTYTYSTDREGPWPLP
jgi:hypothetical protein